ncbi:lipocalin-like domain-containing protein [Roseococcus sp. YIM B11640]|uniref:lipocalin-like domain-containing protein n=1 Tax=Roseococcus sp. YIM B11640 TaxID=3133973 RepID=UPI003C7D6596
MATADELIGTWRMLSWTRKAVRTGEVTDAMGPDPNGYISYHADGRMMALVLNRHRPPLKGATPTEGEKAALFDSMLAYSARYRLEGDRVIHMVDASWNPAWGVTELIRPFTLEGDKLVISGAPGTDPKTGDEVVYRMEFRKVPPLLAASS